MNRHARIVAILLLGLGIPLCFSVAKSLAELQEATFAVA